MASGHRQRRELAGVPSMGSSSSRRRHERPHAPRRSSAGHERVSRRVERRRAPSPHRCWAAPQRRTPSVGKAFRSSFSALPLLRLRQDVSRRRACKGRNARSACTGRTDDDSRRELARASLPRLGMGCFTLNRSLVEPASPGSAGPHRFQDAAKHPRSALPLTLSANFRESKRTAWRLGPTLCCSARWPRQRSLKSVLL